jgi:YD repeat-containing protein
LFFAFSHQHLTHDPNGNTLSRDDLNGGTHQSFTYDPLDRLATATDSANLYPALGFTYDANGNRQTETRASTTTNYGYRPATNALAYAGTDAYWADLTGDTRYITRLGMLTYDGYGRLTQIGTTAYTYDAFNRRQRKTVNGVTTLFHYLPTGELLIESQTTNGINSTQQQVTLDGQPLARIDSNAIYYYHTDNLGTPPAP